MASIAGKVYALTGGVSGLGLVTASRLAFAKARALSIADLNPAKFETARKHIHAINPDIQISTTKLDVRSSIDVNAWIKETVATYGALDGAVNCAGTINTFANDTKPNFLQETDETWNRVLSINVTGTLYSMRAQVKAMLELPKQPRSIVNVASAASLFHDPTIMSYCVTKAGIVSLTTTIAKELEPLGIRVNSVAPSACRAGMAVEWYGSEEEAVKDMAKRGITLIDPESVADTIVWLLGEGSKDVYGVNIPIGATVP